MLIKTSKLTGAALNWAVQEAEFKDEPSSKDWVMRDHATGQRTNPYSTDCCWGFPIIEREKIDLYQSTGRICAAMWENLPGGERLIAEAQDCPTPLIAAMRCYVASKLGDEVEVPDELT